MPCPTLATVATRSHLAAVRVLFQSVRRWHPEARCCALIVDDPSPNPPIPTPRQLFERLSIADLRLPESEAFCFQYDAFELCNALKPWLLCHLARQDPGNGMVYLDSDIAAYGELSPLTHALADGAGFLTPHTTAEYPRDGAAPGPRDLLLAGQFNAGVVGVGPGEGGRRFLAWWAEAVRHDALVEPAEGLFVDQRFLDAVPCLFPDVRLLRHDGINVAHFNLHARRLERRGGDWWVNDQRLLLFHFTMLRANHADFRPFVTRPLLEQQPLLRELLGAYCADLREAGHAESSRVPYGLGTFTDGTPISKATRRAFREAWIRGDAGGNPRADRHWLEFEARHRASVIAKTRMDQWLRWPRALSRGSRAHAEQLAAAVVRRRRAAVDSPAPASAPDTTEPGPSA